MKPIKLTVRYIIIAFIMYLAYRVTSPDYLSLIDSTDESTKNIVIGAVFSALTLVINGHMIRSIDD